MSGMLSWLALNALRILIIAGVIAVMAWLGARLLAGGAHLLERVRNSALRKKNAQLRADNAETLALLAEVDQAEAAIDVLRSEIARLQSELTGLQADLDAGEAQRQELAQVAGDLGELQAVFSEMLSDYKEFRPRVPDRVRTVERMEHWLAYELPAPTVEKDPG